MNYLVLRTEWTNLHEIWAEHTPIIGTFRICLRFPNYFPFRKDGDSNATGIEKNHSSPSNQMTTVRGRVINDSANFSSLFSGVICAG